MYLFIDILYDDITVLLTKFVNFHFLTKRGNFLKIHAKIRSYPAPTKFYNIFYLQYKLQYKF